MADEVSVEREIKAPPDELWLMIADVTRMGDWSPETERCVWLGGATGPAEGSRFKGQNRQGWRRWSTSNTVTAAEPGRHFRFETRSGVLPIATWDYRVEPTPGGCRVTETWTDQRGGLIKTVGRIISGVADRAEHNRANMEATLDRLAAAAESP
jgi:uncharacterized protein YndB with AHSA1/START domain